MSDTPNLSLSYLAAGQAQKHVTLNESLRRLDAIVQLSVLDRSLGTPPVAPTEGVRYLVPTGAGGAWVGHANDIAAFQDGGWQFYPPRPGWCVYVRDEGLLIAWSGATWNAVQTSINPAPLVGVNTSADATNRLAVKSDAVLFSHDDVTPGNGDVRITLNKAGASKTASLLFQTGYSGRVEIGIAGDDKLRFKVSADGATWTEALGIDGATGNVGIGVTDPQAKLHVGGAVRVGSYAVAALPSASAQGAGAILYAADAAGGAVLVFSDGQDWRRVTDRSVIP